MTNSELHTDFDVKFNRLSSNVYLKTSGQQKDWYLNEAMFKKIYSILDRKSKGEDLNDTKENVSDIETLFEKVVLPVYKIDDLNGRVILPNDFLHPLEASLLVNESCSVADQVTSPQVLKYSVLPLPTTALTSWTLVATIDTAPITLFTTSDVANVGSVLPVEENYLLIDRVVAAVKAKAANLGFSVYWETFNGVYRKNSFIIVQTSNSNWSAIDSTYNTVVSGLPISTFNLNFILSLASSKLVSARISLNEMEERVSKNPFKRTSKQSPLLFMSNGNLIVKLGDFNVSGIQLSYVRKPRRIDFYIQQSIELGSRLGNKYKICQEIVDIAAALCAARSLTQNAQILSQI